MRLKTKLVLAITTLVFLIAGILSLVYVSELLHSAVQQSYDANHMVANQVQFAVRNALQSGLMGRKIDPDNAVELRHLAASALRDNAALQTVVESVNRYSLTVYDINIANSQSITLLSTDPDNEEKPLPVRPNYSQLLTADPIQLMREVFGPPRVFDVVVPLELNGELFVAVHVGVRTTLLRAFYAPWLAKAVTLMGFVLGAALLAGFLLSNLALQPLRQISLQLDTLNGFGDGFGDGFGLGLSAAMQSDAAQEEEETPRQDMAISVSHKIDRFGRRMRNVEEVFSAMKENLDRILGNLQDGILLFTGDGRAVLVSEAARRFLLIERENILGRQAREIFDPSTLLGRALIAAFDDGAGLIQKEILTETGKRIQFSLHFIADAKSGSGLGALLTLHDIESAEAIEADMELARRMAAIGRLTSGVGHEVKNPINAIVVHLELLKGKLSDAGAPAMRHLEIIEAEIHRLDRVVKMLADFSRPVELQLCEQDLRTVIDDVLELAETELSTHHVRLVRQMPPQPLMVNVDADLFKQAALNVIQNGAQSMPEGGVLRVVLEEERKFAVLRIADEGPGIPGEIREKIFDLYFTTKSGGSGIGLAMAYRILQLHYGSIEVQSNLTRGAEFLLRIPMMAKEGRRRLQSASIQDGKGILG
jgi:signal transduction histidine kinase